MEEQQVEKYYWRYQNHFEVGWTIITFSMFLVLLSKIHLMLHDILSSVEHKKYFSSIQWKSVASKTTVLTQTIKETVFNIDKCGMTWERVNNDRFWVNYPFKVPKIHRRPWCACQVHHSYVSGLHRRCVLWGSCCFLEGIHPLKLTGCNGWAMPFQYSTPLQGWPGSSPLVSQRNPNLIFSQ